MALYFADTEITGIKNLIPLSSKDITGLYFADTELFTVWAEYDGTLPAQYSANGSALADYRVYGSAGGVGDDSGTAFGYKLDMSVSDGTTEVTTPIYIGDTPLGEDEYVDYGEGKVYRKTENLFNKANAEIGSVSLLDGSDFPSNNAIRSEYIHVSAGETYYVNVYDGFYFQYCAGYYGTKNFTEIVSNAPPLPTKQAIVIPENVNAIRLIFRKSNTVPYPAITDVNLINATVVSLQPEDPPVPLPALPTVDGVNVVDYAGQSAAVPSRFVAKYRKEGFN